MYKHILHFSILILSILFFLSAFILIKLNYQSNTLLINSNDYPKILDEVHSNIDKYVGKQISVSGYVYIQPDFEPDIFVIAQNILMDSEELIIGFLCSNCTDIPLIPNETVTVTGKIEKCIYNNLQYPIIKVTRIT